MKNATLSESFMFPASPEPPTPPRFQINHSPAFEGGELRTWNHREQRMSASVGWSTEKTDFGFPVFNRTNVFHDRLLGVIAREMQVRVGIRAEIQHMSA